MMHQVIVKDRDVLGGVAVFRGTRVPLQTLLDYLEGGQSLDEFLDDFPTVSREAAIAALEQAKSLFPIGRPTGMGVLFDECVPKKFGRSLVGHDCVTVPDAGFAG